MRTLPPHPLGLWWRKQKVYGLVWGWNLGLSTSKWFLYLDESMSRQRRCWLSLVERLFVRCVPFEMVVLFQELTRWSCQYHCTSQYPHFASLVENTSVSVSLSTISSRVGVTWCSIWMAVLRSDVQVEPQTPALLAAVNKAVEPLCEFIFFDRRSNVISRLVPFWCSLSGWMSHALGDGQLGANYDKVLRGIRLGTLPPRWNIQDTDWSRTVCPFHGSILWSCIVPGCGNVVLNRKVGYE